MYDAPVMPDRILGSVAGPLAAVAVWLAPAVVAAASDRPLVDAVRTGDVVAVRALLERGARVGTTEPDGTTALHWAAHREQVEIAGLLLAAGAAVDAANRYGVTPLALASVNGDAAMIARLLAAGADPNLPNPEGETPLMTAARTGNADALDVLLAAGAEVEDRKSVV